jgi:hypothetical protein
MLNTMVQSEMRNYAFLNILHSIFPLLKYGRCRLDLTGPMPSQAGYQLLQFEGPAKTELANIFAMRPLFLFFEFLKMSIH